MQELKRKERRVSEVLFQPNSRPQWDFLKTCADEALYSGAVGAGKSRALCEKGLYLNLKFPGNQGLLIRKELSALKATTLQTFLSEVLPKSWLYNGRIVHNKSDHRISLNTGERDVDGRYIWSHFYYFGLDKKADQDYPTKILSSQFGWVGVDEGTELSEDEWNVLKTRLRFKIPHFTKEMNDLMPRQIFTATNPDGPLHWLYKRFLALKPAELDRLKRKVVLATPYDNPDLPADYIAKLERDLVGLTRERLLFGKWVQAEGIIYKKFDPVRHVDDKGFLKIKHYKELLFGADSNYPKPRAGVLIGLRADQEIDVLDEFYRKAAHVEELRDWLKGWQRRSGRNLVGFHDPSDANAIDLISSPGITCEKANNQVIPGIDTVSWYFTHDKIRISPLCTALIGELQSYRWKKKKGVVASDKDEDKIGDVPDKDASPDHACDALRYALHSYKDWMEEDEDDFPLGARR